MKLERAISIADEVIKRLSPYCSRIEVAGSVRRHKPTVNDLEFVLIPSDPWNLTYEILGLGALTRKGDKLKRVNHNGVQLDFYYASPETWVTLLLIRTGSKENNIRLATLAKKRGWHLSASGDGLFDEKGQRVAGDSEESIYEALGLLYQSPEGR